MKKQVRDFILEGGLNKKEFIHRFTEFSDVLPYRGNITYRFPEDQILERDKDDNSEKRYQIKCLIDVKGEELKTHRVSLVYLLDDYEN